MYVFTPSFLLAKICPGRPSLPSVVVRLAEFIGSGTTADALNSGPFSLPLITKGVLPCVTASIFNLI